MLKSREELNDYLKKKCQKLVLDNQKCGFIADFAYKTFNIPTGTIIDIITERADIETATEYYLFCLAYSIDKIEYISTVGNYFTETEIGIYLKTKYEEEIDIEFPLIIECMRVAADQWIGTTDINFLMKLRETQRIVYNPETQRTMKRVIRGDKEFYKISVNKKAVDQIANNFKDGSFIPNTITLNIPFESDADFYYDEKKKCIIINSFDHFEMADGYHRYYAMCKVRDEDPDFNQVMELRITNFPETKSKQFIFQEDQKTKMTKLSSDSMNMNNPAVIVLETLNNEIDFVYKGEINRNKGLINLGEFAHIVDYMYFKDVDKEKVRRQIFVVKNELKQIFATIVNKNIEYLEKRYSYTDLLFILKSYNLYKNTNIDWCDKAIGLIENQEVIDKKRFSTRKLSKPLLAYVDKLLEGSYV